MAQGACRLFKSQVGVATTGYAEPAPEFNALEPFAYWAIAIVTGASDAFVRSGRVDCPGAARVIAQAAVADAVVFQLIQALREWRQLPVPS
jgi:nicotinamide-nucleotide amidase